MNFKEWLFNEMGDIVARDTSHITLTRGSNVKDYKYTFVHNGQNYTVNMANSETSYGVDGYNITFTGPNGYGSTGTAGTSASVIYTQLLLAIKKLFETTQVDALNFSPAEPAMGLVYRRFFNQYLKKDFMQVDGTTYIRKSKLQEYLKTKPDEVKKRYYLNILDSNRDTLRDAKRAEAEKFGRLKLKKTNQMFFYINNGDNYPIGYLVKSDKTSANFIALHNEQQPREKYISFADINFDYAPSEKAIQRFLQKIANPEKNIELNDFFASQDGNKLKQILARYNIHLPSPEEHWSKFENQFIYYSDWRNKKNVIYIYEVNFDHGRPYFYTISATAHHVEKDAIYVNNENLDLKTKPSLEEIEEFLKNLNYSTSASITLIISRNEHLKKLMQMHNIKPDMRNANVSDIEALFA